MLIFNHTYHIFASLYIATTILNIDKILNLQNKRIRIMLNLNKNDSVKEQFKKLGNVDKLGIVHLQHCVVVLSIGQLFLQIKTYTVITQEEH